MKARIQDSIKKYWEDKSEDNLGSLKVVLAAELGPNDYSELAVKTEGSTEPVPRRLERTKTARLLHASMGMCTGVAELYQNIAKASIDVVNFREELGDAVWYPAIIANVLDISMESLLLESNALSINMCRLYLSESTVIELSAKLNEASIAVGEIQDVVRRHVFYGKLLDFSRLTQNLAIYVHCIQEIGAALGIEYKEMAVTNLTKLIVRFGESFVDQSVALV